MTNDAVTSARMVRVIGMSVRATSQPIGAAITQHAMLEQTATMTVVISGSRNSGSLNSVRNWSSVNERACVAGSTR